ncbi:MAG: hypothetical protein ABH831_00015 [Candidatus Nealsonbacteria bacterium]
MKKFLLLAVLFLFLGLAQTSFMVYFSFFGIIPNLLLISVIILNLLEKSEKKSGLVLAVWAGFILDLFSFGSSIFGFYAGLLLLLAIFIKFILKKYVQIPTLKAI